MSRVTLEYEFLLDQNKSMYEMLQWCDQARIQDSIALTGKDDQLAVKEDQLENRQVIIAQWEEKYNLADSQGKRERRRKYLYMGTTTSALVLLVVSLFN